jgi:uroporphyrinogen decarboxylase
MMPGMTGGQLYGFCDESTRRIFEAVPDAVDVTAIAEDRGAQDRPPYSRAHLQEFCLPHMKRMMDLAHEAGVRVNTHTDGAVRDIQPGLIDMGMDIFNPVQWRCAGMEREGLQRDSGDRIVFEGGMDNQHTLPFGSVAEVRQEARQEVRDNLAILGAGGGYILAPCHNIQVVAPAGNVVAIYETGYAEGRR